MPAITLGTISADGTGSLVEWDGGYAAIWFGINDGGTDRYTFGTGTAKVQISDANDTDGARDLKLGSLVVARTAPDMLMMYIPAGWLRYVMTGSTSPNLGIRIDPI